MDHFTRSPSRAGFPALNTLLCTWLDWHISFSYPRDAGAWLLLDNRFGSTGSHVGPATDWLRTLRNHLQIQETKPTKNCFIHCQDQHMERCPVLQEAQTRRAAGSDALLVPLVRNQLCPPFPPCVHTLTAPAPPALGRAAREAGQTPDTTIKFILQGLPDIIK